MSALDRRISRLEERLAPDPDDPLGLRKLSDEEFRDLLRDECIACLGAANSTLSAQDRVALQDCITAVEREIRKSAESVVCYPDHYRSKADTWNTGLCAGLTEYEPPVADHHDVPSPGAA